jgi:hypothetical protein
MTKSNAKFFLFFLVPLGFFIVSGMFFRNRQNSRSHQAFEKAYTNTVAGWVKKTYVALQPIQTFAARLGAHKVEGREHLVGDQYSALTNTLCKWFQAYSAGSKESYLAFRLPEGARWHWKTNALQQMSDYFSVGIVFDDEEQEDAWIRQYGNPNRITNFAWYADTAKDWSPEKVAEVRERWIQKYGATEHNIEPPPDPFEQWLTIVNDSAGRNWFSNYWRSVCLDEMRIVIESSAKEPEGLRKFPFTRIQNPEGYTVTAPFPNIGFNQMHKKSMMEWDFSYATLLAAQGALLSANICCFITCAPPDDPRPMLLRLVYVNELKTWVPTEMIEASIKSHGIRPSF